MRRLRPLPLRDKYYRAIEKETARIFYELIFKDLLALIPKELRNDINDPLYTAIEKGTVWIERGRIFGTFNASITKTIKSLGGKYNPKSKTFSLKEIPNEYRMASVIAKGNFATMQGEIIRRIDDINLDDINTISNIPDEYFDTINSIDQDFVKAVRSYAIAPNITQESANVLSAEWGYNLDLYIRKWTAENIIKMRSQISSNIMGGQRIDKLAKVIESNYKQSQNKAKFLARQETSLLMSKYHEQKYKSLGITKYIWETSHDERVRHSHAELNGEVIYWDKPPVVDPKSGRTAHAGEDFNCRCVAIAVVD